MKRDNPCLQCPDSRAGCGRHATCEKYIAFHQKNVAMSEEKKKRGPLLDYTSREIAKAKAGLRSANRYRPKERW